MHSRIGETISETLVALLIASLALLMLAGAVTTATRVVTQSNDKMTDYYNKNSALADHTALQGNVSISIKDEETFALETTNIPCYINNSFNGTNVISYAITTPTPNMP